MSGLLCHSALSTRPFLAALSAPALGLFRSPAAPHLQAPLLPRPDLPCGLISRCAGPGSPTKKGHGEPRRQVSAELLAAGPRAGRAGPGVLPLSAWGLCVRVPRPHHSPLGPGQVSAASPAAPPFTPLYCKLPSVCGKRMTSLLCPALSSFRLSLCSALPPN